MKGAPIALEQKEQRPVYFDQGGRYTSRLQIRRIPSRVVQEGASLLIEEIPVKDGLREHPLPQPNNPSKQDEISEWIALRDHPIDSEALSIAGKASSSFEDSEKKCSFKTSFPDEIADSSSPGLYIFISFSVPLESWIDLSLELDKAGGSFVLNGIPNHSFSEFALK